VRKERSKAMTREATDLGSYVSNSNGIQRAKILRPVVQALARNQNDKQGSILKRERARSQGEHNQRASRSRRGQSDFRRPPEFPGKNRSDGRTGEGKAIYQYRIKRNSKSVEGTCYDEETHEGV